MSVLLTNKTSGYRLEAKLWLPRSIAEVFAFFADARNLDAITPEWVRFRILTPLPVMMRSGLLLDYRLRVHGIPMSWRSEITAWDPHRRFVDEQRKGPYRRWVHEHLFRAKDGGTEVIDCIDYAVPGGRLVHRLLVKGDVTTIFRYRRWKLMEIFRGDPGSDGQTGTLAPV